MRRLLTILSLFLFTSVGARADTVCIGKSDAKIVPEQVATLTFQSKGIISDLLLGTEHRIEKGTVIAVMDKEKTEQEREDTELQIRRERLNKKDEIRKLELQREKLRFYMSLNERERTYAAEYKPEDGIVPTNDTITDINERIELSKLELNTMERRKRLDFDSKHEQLTLRMPFTGRVQFHFNIPEHPERPFEYVLNPAVPFATVCDDSAFYITVSINDSDLGLIEPEALSATVRLPGGRQLSGLYAFRRVERSGSHGDMLVYFFRIPEEDHSTAFNMLGSRAEAVLMYTTADDCRRINKAELLTHPAAPDCESWEQLIQAAYPDYVLLLVAERDLIIRPKSAAPAGKP